MKAKFNNKVIADSDNHITLESHAYFPPKAVHMEYLKKSDKQYTCPWKGVCDYYDIIVDGKVAVGAAWMYPKPSKAAHNIKGYYAFWKDVEVSEIKSF